MTYELAKKLKDAGFPLEETNSYGYDFLIDGKRYILPTLSELIEACGEKIHALEFGIMANSGNRKSFIVKDNAGNYMGACSTPEEAVANLWLELNKV